MRARRAVTFLLLVAFFCGFGAPWVGDAHQFNDDPHWVVRLGTDAPADTRLGVRDEGDDVHCAVCHLLRTLRSANRPMHATVVREVRQLVPPRATDPCPRTAAARPDGARAPPPSVL